MFTTERLDRGRQRAAGLQAAAPRPASHTAPRAFQGGRRPAAPDFPERVVTPRTVCTFEMGKKNFLGEIPLSYGKGKLFRSHDLERNLTDLTSGI